MSDDEILKAALAQAIRTVLEQNRWRIVPEEPTPAMLDAALRYANLGGEIAVSDLPKVWWAMLKALPRN